MHKNVFLGVFACALSGGFAVGPLEAMESHQFENELFIQIQPIPGTTNKVRVTLPKFNKAQLEKNVIDEVAARVTKTCKKGVRIVFDLPNSVMKIGREAFSSMREELEELNVSAHNSLETISGEAFAECTYLKQIGGGTSNPFPRLMHIGAGAFRECRSLTAFPFDEETPLESVEGQAFENVGCVCLKVPKTLKGMLYSLFCEPLKTVFIPKESQLRGVFPRKLRCKGMYKTTFFIEPGIKADVLLRILRNPIFRQSSFNISATPRILGNFVIGKPGDQSLEKYNRKIEIAGHKLYFSINNLSDHVENAYKKYIKFGNKADTDYKALLNCFSTEMILYALSQDAEVFLRELHDWNPGDEYVQDDDASSKELKEKKQGMRQLIYGLCQKGVDAETLLSLIGRGFIVIRFMADRACRDLCEACPDLEVSPDLIRGCLLEEPYTASNRKRHDNRYYETKTHLLNVIRNDNLGAFMKVGDSTADKGEYFFERLSIPYYYEFIENYFFGNKDPDDLPIIGLVGLFGAAKIFKYILSNIEDEKSQNLSELMTENFHFILLGGNPEIIRVALERIDSFDLFRSFYRRRILMCIDYLPYPKIYTFLKENKILE